MTAVVVMYREHYDMTQKGYMSVERALCGARTMTTDSPHDVVLRSLWGLGGLVEYDPQMDAVIVGVSYHTGLIAAAERVKQRLAPPEHVSSSQAGLASLAGSRAPRPFGQD